MKNSISKFLIIAFVTILNLNAHAQKTASIVYEQYENGKLIPSRFLNVKCSKSVANIINSASTEKMYINYRKRITVKTAKIQENKFAVVTSFDALSQAVLADKIDTILGYICKKAVYDVFSNKIEVWYTNQCKFKGSPSISFAPIDGLVLKYIVNGNRTILAKSITLNDETIDAPGTEFAKVDDATYAAIQIKSRYIRIPVFEKEQINFENNILNKEEELLNHTYRYSKGNVILRKIKLPENNDKGLFFVQLSDWSNGDAYDRVGSVFTFSVKNEKTILNALRNGIGKLPVYTDNTSNAYQGICATFGGGTRWRGGGECRR